MVEYLFPQYKKSFTMGVPVPYLAKYHDKTVDEKVSYTW